MRKYDWRTVIVLADAAFNFIILRRTHTIKNPWYWRTTGLDGVLTALLILYFSRVKSTAVF